MMYRWPDLLRIAGLSGVYLLLTGVGRAFIANGDVAPIMCFSSGLALAVLLIGGKKYWPGIWLGAGLAALLTGRSLPVALITATGHVLEPLFAIWLLDRIGGFDSLLRRKQDFFKLLLAGIASPWVTAVSASIALYAGGRLSAGALPADMLQSWMGGLAGIVLVTPMLLIWRQPKMDWFRPERGAEFLLLFSLAFLCGQIVFLGWLHNSVGIYISEYLMLVFVAWAGVRFGRHGVQLVILLVLAQVWMGMLQGTGSFGEMSRVSMIKLWFYLVEMAAIGVAVATVIREKNDSREVVSESEQRFRNMFHKHSSVMLLVDPASGQIVDANHAATDFYGYAEAELKAMLISQINALPQQEAVAKMQRALCGEQTRFTFTHRLRDGERRIVSVYSSPIEVSGRPLLFSIVMDVTESKRMELELEMRANTDALTGLPNRRHLMELAEQELARAQRYEAPFSLLLLDVDYFKRINDTYGHKAGDLALQALSDQCRHELREVDVIGRFGGEEFAVILPETDQERALEAAERLRQQVAAMRVPLPQGDMLEMTVSIGLAVLTETVGGLDELLQQADKALYAAKQAGRNQVRSFVEISTEERNLPLFSNLAEDVG